MTTNSSTQAFQGSNKTASPRRLVLGTASRTIGGNFFWRSSEAGGRTELLWSESRANENDFDHGSAALPGFTFTVMPRPYARAPSSRVASYQVAERLINGVERGDFYISGQDNETSREQDEC